MITTPGPTHQAIPHTTREAIRRHQGLVDSLGVVLRQAAGAVW